MSYKVPKRKTYDYNRSRKGSVSGLTDEDVDSPIIKKIEELQRASGEIKCAECRHIFDTDEIFGMLQ